MKKWLFGFLWMLSMAAYADGPLIDLAAEINPELAKEAEPSTPEAEKQDEAKDAKPPPTQEVSAPPVETPPAKWGYLPEVAPHLWAKLDSRYSLCDEGKSQSPIDLRENEAVLTRGMPGLDVAYREVPLRLILSDHGLRGEYPLGSYIRLGEQRYEFTHYTLHTPSEHHLDGFAYPMEIQLHHRDGDGHQVVLSVIIQEGKANPHLTTLLQNIPQQRDKLQVFEQVNFNPVRFLPQNKRFYRYIGSMTTPPCREGVIWLVFQQPIDASVSQLVQFQQLMGENVRPLQPLNGRLPLKSWLDASGSAPPQNGVGYYFDY
ncbi:MAG: carbonic anhydrase [Thiomicrospira sp.]